MIKSILEISLFIFISTYVFGGDNVENKAVSSYKPVKYVAFSADTEAYFTPVNFEQFQGEYTSEIIKVCELHDIPFTWLIIVDKHHVETRAMAEKHYPLRKHIDEFSLHAHFKWFIMSHSDDFESFKMPENRIQWLTDAKNAIKHAGLPKPRTFRYGGGDSQANFYHIEDIKFLIDKLGIRNFLFSEENLQNVIGIGSVTHLHNNVWEIDGKRKVTLLSTCVYLDVDEEVVIRKIYERLDSADYAVIGCHDYRKNVPVNMHKAIEAINEKYSVRYVTIDQLGKLIRKGKVKNPI